MKTVSFLTALASMPLLLVPAWAQNGSTLSLDTLDLSHVEQDYGSPHAGHSIDNHPLTLGGKVYEHGIGTHANSVFSVDLKGAATAFSSVVGVDDETGTKGSVVFRVIVDRKTVAATGVMHGGDAPQTLNVPLTGAKRLTLIVEDAGDGIYYDHADWADAQLTLAAGATETPVSFETPKVPPRLTILPEDPHPAIHGARITGATPGYPFLYRIAATGTGPLTFAAKGLPDGLTLDPQTGIISGALKSAGTTRVQLTVSGALGHASRELTIVGGDHKLALTPPMGWNSWNVWAGNVTEENVKAAADSMIKSGLAAHGYQYVNIDDTWEAKRNDAGEIQTNSKFPDMKGLADYVHAQGLKVGIYSSPGPTTCAGYPASYQHEDQDAKSYADWGFDYLKYDWCSYGSIAKDNSLPELQKPYAVMRSSLDKVNRDILFSFCQYGMGDVWKWGEQIGGNCWRTTGDINDSWGSLHSIYESQDGHQAYSGPGHWNDPDMLVVGSVGWGNPHPSHLTPNEQILHISLWCLFSAPLLSGCDMDKLDPFTLALLTNDEAIDIDQDPLGKAAGKVATDAGGGEVWARPLFDGTTAAGLVNPTPDPLTITAKWSDLGIKGKQPVRDLWLHKNAGSYKDGYTVEVPAHGCVLVKIGKPKQP
jgi:alpha-galactosidase